jgi:hypothetical protein
MTRQAAAKQVTLKDRYSGGIVWLTVRDGVVVGAQGTEPKRYLGMTLTMAKHYARYGDQPLKMPSHAHATKKDRVADLIESYGTWTQRYSNEDFDRKQSLAGQLTSIDREEGRPAPAVGYSKERYAQATRVVDDANSYGAKQQSLSKWNKGSAHATKRKTMADYDAEGYAAKTWYIADCPYTQPKIRDAWQAGAWRWQQEQRGQRGKAAR